MNTPIDALNTALEGHYRVERQLGEGGMASVYLAEDLKHHRKVALKVLKPELAAIVGAERFLAEIETTANLQHPNILPLFDSGEVEGPDGEGPRSVFYVMPYVEDETLRERLDREKQLPVDEAVRIAVEVADALDHAHRQGVIHRDIKPANILLKDGRPLVADFGIALAASRSGGGERLTETGMSLGTPYYMSPEQATGSQAVGPATDIYALGCVLYEMLVGEPPYTGSTPQAVLGKIITGDAPPVTETRRTAPPNVEGAVAKAIEKLSADRFRSAKELGRALQDPGFRHGPSVAARAEPETRRWKAVAAALGAVALILAAGLIGTLASPGDDGEGETSPVRFTSVLFPEGSPPDEMSANTVQPLGLTGDGSRIVYAAEGESGQQQLWIRPLGGRVSLPVAGTEGAASFALSPDDRWVAFNRSEEGLLQRISVEGGRAVTVTETGLDGRARFHGLAWGGDGTIVFSTETGLHRVAADGGTSSALTHTDPQPPAAAIDPEPSEQHGEPVFLPDGGGVMFTRWRFDRGSGEGESEVVALRFDGEPETLVSGHSPVVTEDGILVFSRDGGDLWAAELNGAGTGLTGDPIPVLDGGPATLGGGFPRALYAVSDDGTLAYLPGGIFGGNRHALVWADREGSTELILNQGDLPSGASALMAMRLSPDRSRLAFRAVFPEPPRFRLFLYDVPRAALTALRMDMNADWPVWTPDGEHIVFNRFSEDGQDLYRIRADGTGEPERLWPSNPMQQHPHGFSPDGRYFVYQERPDPQHPDMDLWVLPLEETGEPRVVVGGPGNQQDAAIHPSGRWLAFVSDETGRQEVYVTEFPESGGRTRLSVNGGYSPVWSPEGGELFFRSGIGRPRRDEAPLAVARVSTDPVFRVESVRSLFSGRYRACCASGYGKTFDVGSEGDRFVLVERAFTIGSDVPRIELAQNWLDEVRRRLRE